MPPGLSGSDIASRTCPACEAQLTNPDDAVVTQLNPSEEYKTSVLSGLSPTIIMECASRGMNFFQYQTTQEMWAAEMYQDYMAKNFTEKYATLSTQLDNVISDANSEIMGLRDKLSALHLEKKNLEQKNHELAGAFKEKSRAQQRLQTLYQRVKSQMNAAQMEDAAANDVENVIHSVTTPHFINDVQGAPGQQRHGMVQSRNSNIPQIYRRPRGPGSNASDEKRSAYAWAGQQPALHGSLHSSQSAPVLNGAATPTHRTRIPVAQQGRTPGFMGYSGYGASAAASRQATPVRQPLGPVDPNVYPHTNYGMSAGMKMGRQNVPQYSRTAQPIGRTMGGPNFPMR
ncbi:hypothetical protein H2203_003279 [Taxawa tesnikishii (nom. ined.)]|nr:hypothetical protein H2203_003279 [Dothideales sp. JES 119]